MNPTHRDVHSDVLLSNISVAYRNGMYIAEQIFPVVKVGNASDKYLKFTKGEWFRDEAQKRAPGGRSEGGGFTISTDTFFCDEIAFHTLLEDETRDNADTIIGIETAKVNFVTDKILLRLEARVAALVQTHGNWGSSVQLAGTDQWSDYDNSDPISDINAGVEAIEDNTGYLPNTMVMGIEVWRKLRHHPQLLDRLPVTTLRQATLATLRDLLDIDRLLIGRANVNTAALGQTDSFSKVWNKNVWIGYVAPAPAKETASAGYVFAWPRDGKIRGVRRWRDEDHHSDKMEAFMCFDEKVIASDVGYVIRDSIA